MDHAGPVRIVPPEDAKAGQGLTMYYENGVEMIHNRFEGDVKADCVFEGSDGMILVSRNGISSRPEHILEEPLGDKDQRVMASNNHHQNWLESIRSGSPTICSAETGHRSAAVCHLANLGYRLRRELRWNPVEEQFSNDSEANRQLTRQPRQPW
jgi:hypothetical protein